MKPILGVEFICFYLPVMSLLFQERRVVFKAEEVGPSVLPKGKTEGENVQQEGLNRLVDALRGGNLREIKEIGLEVVGPVTAAVKNSLKVAAVIELLRKKVQQPLIEKWENIITPDCEKDGDAFARERMRELQTNLSGMQVGDLLRWRSEKGEPWQEVRLFRYIPGDKNVSVWDGQKSFDIFVGTLDTVQFESESAMSISKLKKVLLTMERGTRIRYFDGKSMHWREATLFGYFGKDEVFIADSNGNPMSLHLREIDRYAVKESMATRTMPRIMERAATAAMVFVPSVAMAQDTGGEIAQYKISREEIDQKKHLTYRFSTDGRNGSRDFQINIQDAAGNFIAVNAEEWRDEIEVTIDGNTCTLPRRAIIFGEHEITIHVSRLFREIEKSGELIGGEEMYMSFQEYTSRTPAKGIQQLEAFENKSISLKLNALALFAEQNAMRVEDILIQLQLATSEDLEHVNWKEIAQSLGDNEIEMLIDTVFEAMYLDFDGPLTTGANDLYRNNAYHTFSQFYDLDYGSQRELTDEILQELIDPRAYTPDDVYEGVRGYPFPQRVVDALIDLDIEEAIALVQQNPNFPAGGVLQRIGSRIVYVSPEGDDGERNRKDLYTDPSSPNNGKNYTIPHYVTVLLELIHEVHNPNQVPEGGDDSASTDFETSVLIDVLGNDNDPNGDNLRITNLTQPANGTTVVENGQVKYTPADGFSGEDTFTYTPNDGTADGAVVTVTVDVEAPDAGADAANTPFNTAVDIKVLDNDGGATSITSVNGTNTSGTLELINGNTEVRFTPATGFVGETTFTYTNNLEETATVTVTVEFPAETTMAIITDDNTIGEGQNKDLRANPNLAAGVTMSSYLWEVSADGGNTFITLDTVQNPGNTPFSSGTYTVRLSGVDSLGRNVDAGGITFTVDAAPEGQPESAIAVDRAVVSIFAGANDTFSGPATFNLANNAANGVVTVVNAATGEFAYQANPGTFGPDSFAYTITDRHGVVSEPITVTVDHQLSPIDVANDSMVVQSGGTKVINVLTNDSGGEGQNLDVVSVSPSAQNKGEVTISNPDTGVIQFRAFSGQVGSDSFTYIVRRASDGATATATVTIDIQGGPPPSSQQ